MFTLSLPLSLSKTLLTCNLCDEVPFSCSNDVILYLVEELVTTESGMLHCFVFVNQTKLMRLLEIPNYYF